MVHLRLGKETISDEPVREIERKQHRERDAKNDESSERERNDDRR
jgi:hypothetical protein